MRSYNLFGTHLKYRCCPHECPEQLAEYELQLGGQCHKCKSFYQGASTFDPRLPAPQQRPEVECKNRAASLIAPKKNLSFSKGIQCRQSIDDLLCVISNKSVARLNNSLRFHYFALVYLL